MDQLLLVFTGGTIGSIATGRQIDVRSSVSSELVDRYLQRAGEHAPQLTTMQPFNILSENLLPQDWIALKESIADQQPERYSGIIITHGTDTLAYSAAALSYLFHDTRVPIVMIASNYPLADPRSRGVQNLEAAIAFICSEHLPGVFVCFENKQGEALLHLGSRIRQSAPFTDEYESAYGLPFGQMKDGCFHPVEHAVNPKLEQLTPLSRSLLPQDAAFTTDVVYIQPYPGLDYSYYSFDQANRPQAILHDLYHSATAGTRSDREGRYSLPAFIQRCRQAGIPVYLCPFKEENAHLYATSSVLLEAGAIPLRGITSEAALVKLMLAYGTPSLHPIAATWVQHTTLLHEHIAASAAR